MSFVTEVLRSTVLRWISEVRLQGNDKDDALTKKKKKKKERRQLLNQLDDQ